MRMRRSAAAIAMAAAVTIPAAVTGVAAYAQSSSSSAAAGPSAAAAKKPEQPKPAKPTKAPVKKVNFQASGSITKVDTAAGTLTVAARSGTKDVRGKTVTMKVAADARIVLNGKKVKLDVLAAGQKVSVTGTRVDAAYTAAKIQAAGKPGKPSPSPSVSSPTSEPTVTPTTEPTTEPTVTPTTEPTVTPTTAPTTAPTTEPTTAPTETPSEDPTES
jgi:phage baseplate assembly protein gpV